MMSTIPIVPAFETMALLLRVISDPVEHKARLDELMAQEKATKEQISTLTEMADETRRKKTAAEAMTIVLTNRKTALDAREGEIEERAKNLDLATAARAKDAQQADQKARQKDDALTSRENALQQRETALVARESAAVAEAKRLAALRTELESKLAKIKQLAA